MAPQLTLAEQFGRKLRQLRREKSAREERDVEQGEVAKAVGESQPNLARYEKGRIPKDENVTKRLAKYYGVEYAWLRLDEGEAYPPLPKERAESSPAAATRAAVARSPRGR